MNQQLLPLMNTLCFSSVEEGNSVHTGTATNRKQSMRQTMKPKKPQLRFRERFLDPDDLPDFYKRSRPRLGFRERFLDPDDPCETRKLTASRLTDGLRAFFRSAL